MVKDYFLASHETNSVQPKKISGRLCFDREELYRVLVEGDHKKGRGRPRK